MEPTTIIMLAVLAVLIFFMFRNSRKRQKDQAELATKMVPGVEVMLSFGVYGTLRSVDEEQNIAEVEIAEGTVIRVHRQTLTRVIEPAPVSDGSHDDLPEVEGSSTDDRPSDVDDPRNDK